MPTARGRPGARPIPTDVPPQRAKSLQSPRERFPTTRWLPKTKAVAPRAAATQRRLRRAGAQPWRPLFRRSRFRLQLSEPARLILRDKRIDQLVQIVAGKHPVQLVE